MGRFGLITLFGILAIPFMIAAQGGPDQDLMAQGAALFQDQSTSVIYENSTGTELWTSDPCGKLAFDRERAVEGNAIHLKWDKTQECDWVGFGIGWNNWKPKDLREVMSMGAIQFQLRAFEGESRVPAMVFLLEDYGALRTAAAFRPKFMEMYPLNEEWRTVTLPMNSFPAEHDGVDLANIKQIVVELQGDGNILLDNIKIVPISAAEQTSPATFGSANITPLGALPLDLFEGEFNNVWGLEKNECRDFQLSDRVLQLEWWADCEWSPMGFSWNRWVGVDMSAAMQLGVLEVRADIPAESGPLLIEFNDYDRFSDSRASLVLQDYLEEDGIYRIPLIEFKQKEPQLHENNIKDLWIDSRGSGKASIFSIRLVRKQQ